MRSRTIREGTVGLIILLGLGAFGLLLLWLRGFNLGNRSYRFAVEFREVAGMQNGAPVRYRGVDVGRITGIQPSAIGVAVEIEIDSAALSIPLESLIQVNQSGLIGETSVDIMPDRDLELPNNLATNPLADNCSDARIIICDGDRLPGEVGVSFNELIEATTQISELFGDEVFFNEVRTLTRNSADAAAAIADLSRSVTTLTESVDEQLTTLATAATATTESVGRTADDLGATAEQVTALVAENRVALASTLENISQATRDVQTITAGIAPLMENGEFVQNLETLSANAAEASANLRNLSESVGSPENLLLFQQTLESARATFQNVQKITADLDELTGDPAFRQNIRELINGLSNLVSFTEQFQEQAELAQVLTQAEQSLPPTPDSPVPTPPALPDRLESTIPLRLTLLDPDYNIRLQPFPHTSMSDPLQNTSFQNPNPYQ
jgi:phospholipid/cholesterol/gamma-HCH transport system substrate-binding protein